MIYCRLGCIAAIVTLLAATGAGAQTTPTVTYAYDTLGRVISATYSGGPNDGLVITYTYDAAGNRTAYQSNGAGNTQQPSLVVIPSLGGTIIIVGP
jgi:YD repeat-containing protein